MFEIGVKTYRHFIATDHINPCYEYHIKTFLDFQKAAGLDLIPAVVEYFKSLNQSDYKAGTIRMKRQAVKNRLKEMSYSMPIQESYQVKMLLERLDKNPETKPPKLNTAAVGINKVLTESEYNLIKLKCRSKRLQLFIKFLYATGCRVSEMTGIKLKDCKIEDGLTYIRITGKGNKERQIIVPEGLYNAITDTFSGQLYLFETSGGKPYRRTYITDQIKKITGKAIGRRLSAHCLRHTFITRQIKDTGMITAVSKYAGHSSVSTTLAMYNHEQLTPEQLSRGI